MSESVAPREMGVSDARANMTEVIAEVRLLGRPVVLTRREKPQAVLVPVPWYEQARDDRVTAEAVRRLIDELPNEKRRAELARDLQRHREHLLNPGS